MQTGGKGVKKSENFADVICTWPLTSPVSSGPAGAALHGDRGGVLRVPDAAHVPQPVRDHLHGARPRLHGRRTGMGKITKNMI